MKHFVISITFVLLLGPCHVFAQSPTVDDFLPPVQGGTKEIKNQAEVKVNADVVEAATPQDAMNAAVEANIKAIQEDPKKAKEFPEIGARWVKFKSGGGILATGVAVYQEQTNPTAGLIAQRNAFVVAYTNAKAAMAQQLGEISSVGKTIVTDVSKQIISAEATDQESAGSTVEIIEQAAQALLKGYVTYSIDEIEDGTDASLRYVFVSLASYPKTLTSSQRTGALQEAADLSAGIQNVLDEVKNGIVPPVGGRVVTVPSSGQTAFIAFGSAIVTPARNPALSAKNKLTAQKIADARAYDALTGILTGDQTVWKTGIMTKTDVSFAETERYAMDETDSEKSIATVEAARQAFTSETTIKESVESIRRGVLPPGIQKRSWIEDDGNWAMTMVAYYPDMTEAALKFGKKMGSADLLSGSRNENSTGSGRAGVDLSPKKVDSKVKPKEGGKVGDDDGI